MARAAKSLLEVEPGMRARALGMLRPGVEALLLAAVALGCVQAAWSVLTPRDAGAGNPAADTNDTNLELADVQSPFAPNAVAGGESHAVDALLATLQLSGVRMSVDPTRSGAFLTLGDGAQRAYLIGQEVVSGVTLTDVGESYVLLSYDGGQRQLAMAQPQSYSFARALMGLEAAPAQAAPVEAPAVAANTVAEARPASFTPADGAWLRETLQRVETVEGRAYGWRVGGAMPEAVRAAGLQENDVIVAVNGAGPDNSAGVLAAAQAPSLQLSVDRAGARVTITLDTNART